MLDITSIRQSGRRLRLAAFDLARRHAVSLSLTAAALVLAILLWSWSQRFPFALFIAAVLLAVWRGGPREGLVTLALSTGALALLHLARADTQGAEDDFLPRLGMFVLAGLIGCYLGKQCMQAVQASEHVQSALSQLGNGLIFADTSGRVTYLNELAQSLTGWSQAAAQGQPLEHVCPLVHEDSGRSMLLTTAEVLREGVASELAADAVLSSAAGSTALIEGNIAPVRSVGDRIVGLALTFRDVGQRREADREWRQHSEAVVRASEQRLAASLRQAQEDAQRQIDELVTARKQAEDALRLAQDKHQKELQQCTIAKEQAEKALQAASDVFHRQMEEKSTALRRAEETLGKKREEFEDLITSQKQAAEEQRKAETDLRRQINQSRAAHEQSEQSLRKAQGGIEGRLAEHLAGREDAEKRLRAAQEEWKRQLAESASARKGAEDELRILHDEFQKQLADRTAAWKQEAEAALRPVREDHEKHLAQQVTERRQAEETAQQAQAAVSALRAELEAVKEALQTSRQENGRRREVSDSEHVRLHEGLEAQLLEAWQTIEALRQEKARGDNQQAASSESGTARVNGHKGAADSGRRDAADWLSFN